MLHRLSQSRIPLLLFLICLLALQPGMSVAASSHRLFIVHAYGPDNPTALPQERGLLKKLAQAGWQEGKNLKMARFFMDTKEHYISPEQIHQRGVIALERIRQFNPDIVVTIDDNAFTEVAPALTRSGIPVVFTGLNTPPEVYGYRFPFMAQRKQRQIEITGVYENLHIHKALEIMHHLLKLSGDDRMAILLDASPTGMGIRLQLDQELKQLPFRKQIDIHTVSTLQAYTRLLRQLSANPHVRAVYAGALKLKVSATEAWNALKIARWTRQHNHIPEMTLSFSLVKAGYMGGIALDMEKMGEQAGEKVARILAGTPAHALPIEDANYYALVFNLKRVRELSLSLPDSLILAADKLYE